MMVLDIDGDNAVGFARVLGKQQCWHLFNSAIFGHKFEKICDLIKSTIYNRDKKPDTVGKLYSVRRAL